MSGADRPGPRSIAARVLLSSRPLSWVNTAYPFAAAVLLAGGAIDAAFVVGTVFFLIPYNLLMYGVNDVFDYASDLANPRKGGVEGALLPPRTHRLVLGLAGALTLAFVVPLVLLGSPLSWLVLAVLLLDVVGYSAPPLRWKEVPVLDSFVSSVHFVGPAVYGLVLIGAPFPLTTVLALLAFLLWGMASHAFGAVQDIGPDRDAGIASVATVLGATRTVRLALAAWILAGVLLLLLPFPATLAAALALPYVWLAWPFRSVPDSRAAETNRGWRRFLAVNYVAGFLITLILIAVAMTRG